MSFTRRLTKEDIRQTDREEMAVAISAMAGHIREAMGFASTTLGNASLPPQVSSVVICGMGGSAIGGDVVRSAYGPMMSVPVLVSRGYDLPAYAGSGTLVIASSYSGNTEETLAQFEEAVRRKLTIVCITTGGRLAARAKELGLPVIAQRGGMQPRAALGYSFTPIVMILEAVGVLKGVSGQLEGAAAHLEVLAERFGTDHLTEANTAFALASQLTHRIPVVYCAADLEAAGLRWRGQLQENAKHLTFGNLLPEMNHNELEGWAHPVDVIEHLFVILLRSPEDEHPRVAKRLSMTKELLAGRQVPVSEITAVGSDRLERLLSLIAMADWTSYYLALFGGIDPTPIPVMSALKEKLA